MDVSPKRERTLYEAEHLKREPAMIALPANTFEPIEDKMSQCHVRLQKVIEEAEQQIGSFDVKQTWCMGGASLTHGWIRNVMLKQVNG